MPCAAPPSRSVRLSAPASVRRLTPLPPAYSQAPSIPLDASPRRLGRGLAWFVLNKGFLCDGGAFEDDTLDPIGASVRVRVCVCVVCVCVCVHVPACTLNQRAISVRTLPGKNERITAVLDLQRGQLSFSAKGQTLGIIEGISGEGLRFFCYCDGDATSCTILSEHADTGCKDATEPPSRNLAPQVC